MSLYSITIKTIIIKTRNKRICFPVKKFFCCREFVSTNFTLNYFQYLVKTDRLS